MTNIGTMAKTGQPERAEENASLRLEGHRRTVLEQLERQKIGLDVVS